MKIKKLTQKERKLDDGRWEMEVYMIEDNRSFLRQNDKYVLKLLSYMTNTRNEL
jgi:hypothetical protein